MAGKKESEQLMTVVLVGIGAITLYMLRDQIFSSGTEDEIEQPEPEPTTPTTPTAPTTPVVPGAPTAPVLMKSAKIGPWDDCEKRRKCNCAACCLKGDCKKDRRSKNCPCEDVLRGIRERQSAALEAEQSIYSYFGSVDNDELPIIIA